MKYKIKFWNDSIKDFQILESPYLESALLTANKLCHKIQNKIFVTDGTIDGCYVVEAKNQPTK